MALLSNDPKIVAQQLKQREFAVTILSSSELQTGMKAFREVSLFVFGISPPHP